VKSGKNIIELRRLLAEKFPGVRMTAGRRETLVNRWPSGVPAIDFQLEGGFGKGCLSEIISTGVACGSSLLLGAMVREAERNSEWIALVDGADSFDPAALTNEELSRLLWVRCSSPREAMKAADLLLHDGTIPILAIDLIRCPRQQLRRIPSSTWHRLARTVEMTATVCVIFTPEQMISTAEARLELQPRYSLESLDAYQETLLEQLIARPIDEETQIAQKRFGATA
jgi:hypothetical protein